MKLNGKLKIDNEAEKALRKSKNKGKHVKIVAELTKREKQILRGEKPENYVNYKNSPMSLIIQLSRQAKLAKINEEYNKQMSMENDNHKNNIKLNSKNNENVKKIDNIIEKINKEEKDKEKAKDLNKNNIKNVIKEKETEKNIKIKIFDSNSNNGKIEKRNDIENKNYNKRQRNNYIEKINTEPNKDINNSPKFNEKRAIKYKKPFLREMFDVNKVFEFKKPILTEKSELILEKKDKKINSSIDKRLFELDYNREDNKFPIRKEIERLRNNDKNFKINSLVKSASNLTNIIKEDKKRKNNKTLMIGNHNNKYNNNNDKNYKINNMINNKDLNINRSHKILLLNNSRSSNNLFNNFIYDNKKDEIKRTDTKVLFKKRPEIISESMKSFNAYNINSNKDINGQRRINPRNVIRNYSNNIIENSKNLNGKEKEKGKADDNNNKLENSLYKRRKYEMHNNNGMEMNSIKEENKEITILRRGTRSNRNNVIISKYSTSYDNSQIDRKEKLKENVNTPHKSIEKKNTKGNLNKTGCQIIHKDNKKKMVQTINNHSNNINNNNISNNRRLGETHIIENEGKNIIIPLKRKYLNHSFDFSKRNCNKNDNKKSNNENIINMKEEKSIGGRFSNLKKLKMNNKIFENNYNLFGKIYVLENKKEGEEGKKNKNKSSPNKEYEKHNK